MLRNRPPSNGVHLVTAVPPQPFGVASRSQSISPVHDAFEVHVEPSTKQQTSRVGQSNRSSQSSRTSPAGHGDVEQLGNSAPLVGTQQCSVPVHTVNPQRMLTLVTASTPTPPSLAIPSGPPSAIGTTT